MPPSLHGSTSTRVHSALLSWPPRSMSTPRGSRARARLRPGQPSPITDPTAVSMHTRGQAPSTGLPPLIPGQVYGPCDDRTRQQAGIACLDHLDRERADPHPDESSPR
jgi:hypothetical protein